MEETLDLSAYDAQTILLRFLYVTDWATTELGFYVDDIVVTDDGGTLLSDDLEAGSGNWALSGWEHTTGQAYNDWGLTYINPVYVKGKFSEYEITEGTLTLSGGSYWDYTTLDTQALTSDMVAIVLSNHLPEGAQFTAEYLLLVEKGNAKD